MKYQRNLSIPDDGVNKSELNSDESIDGKVEPLDDIDLNDNVSNLKKVPQKKIYGYDLKRLKSFKKIRQNYKVKNMQHTFTNDLKFILNEYSPNDKDNELNDELLLEVLNISEEYFIYPLKKKEREEVKRDCVVQLMLPYFRGDELLLNKTIAHLWHRVKKSTLCKRVYQRLKNFFFTK
jgi:hypothetical protein